MKDIVVLSTTLESVLAVSALGPALDQLAGRGNWNVDLHDCDHVLRVTGTRDARPFIELLQEHGVGASELPDEVPGILDLLGEERKVS